MCPVRSICILASAQKHALSFTHVMVMAVARGGREAVSAIQDGMALIATQGVVVLPYLFR